MAALEYVAGLKVSKASDTVLRLLDDPDEFVRFASLDGDRRRARLEIRVAKIEGRFDGQLKP